jgi:MSHA biogenesis protein MshK
MADRMKLAQLLAAAAALSAAAAGSAAQALTDPTRPPSIQILGAAAAGPASGSPLQSILLSATRKGAIINGQYIPLGGAYGEAKLVRITASDVTLKSAHTTEVLKLYPSVEKAPAESGVGRVRPAARP